MRKQRAIALFGEGHAPIAAAVEISTQAVSDWPDPLPRRIADRVIAAAWRLGIELPDDIESDSEVLPEDHVANDAPQAPPPPPVAAADSVAVGGA